MRPWHILLRSRDRFLPLASKTTTSILASFLTSLYAADKPETPPPTTTTSTSSLEFTLADQRGGARDARPPWGSKFFHFHAVFGKKLKNNSTFGSWRPPPGKILDPPLIHPAKWDNFVMTVVLKTWSMDVLNLLFLFGYTRSKSYLLHTAWPTYWYLFSIRAR